MTDSPAYINSYYARHLTEDAVYPVLQGTEEADVCIIGGGLAGINTALSLVERGQAVVLVEARRIGWGASGRNAGMVAKGYAAGEASLAKTLGLEKAQQMVSFTQNARKLIKKRIAYFNIDCGPVIDGVLTVSVRAKAEAMQQYINEANKNFGLGFEFWPQQKVREHCRTDRYFDGIFSPHDFQFNPLRYLRGLAGVVSGKGGQIFENSEVVRVVREGASWVVHTGGGRVKAQHVVMCGSIYMDGVDRRLENAVFSVQSYMMSTAPVDENILKQTINTPHAIYDTRFCSDYYRILPDNRILWGGRVGLWAHPKDIAAVMLKDMFKLYPQLEGHVTAEDAWSCMMCYAPHKMPQIGQLEPGYWYNTAFGGHGLCPTTAGGELIAAAIAEGDETYKAFQPFSLSYAGGKMGRYVAQMVYLWWRTRDYLDV